MSGELFIKKKEGDNGIKRFFNWVKVAQSITWILAGLTMVVFFLISMKIAAFEKDLKEKHINPIYSQMARMEGDDKARDQNICKLEKEMDRLEKNSVNTELYNFQMKTIERKVDQLSLDQKILLDKFDNMKDEIIDVLKKAKR